MGIPSVHVKLWVPIVDSDGDTVDSRELEVKTIGLKVEVDFSHPFDLPASQTHGPLMSGQGHPPDKPNDNKKRRIPYVSVGS